MGSSKVEQRLQTLTRLFRLQKPIKPRSHDRAAVLICLFRGDESGLRVILTKRASTQSSHSSEISLPGGRRDQADADDVETALREAKEEIGLEPSQVNVVTVLEPFVHTKGMHVVPVIGMLNVKEAFKPSLNPAEVESVFDAPMEMFIKDDHRRVETRDWFRKKYLVHVFEFEVKNKKYMIWGLTSSILIRAASIVYERPPPYLEQTPHYNILFPLDSEESQMHSSNLEQRLQILAQKFRLHIPVKPSLSPIGTCGLIKRAAVLVCLFRGAEGELRVILTKRASTLSSHSGEVALPGGKMEQGDADEVDTALREAKEEIGLDPSLVNVVTVIDTVPTTQGMPIAPVIGLLSNKEAFSPAPNVAEVEAIFYAPFEMFLKDENRRGDEVEWKGHKYLLHHFHFEADDGEEYVIWGITAEILIRAASIVYQRQPAFLERRTKL